MARNDSRVTGWWVFAAALLLLAGFLNIIWGIAAIGDAKFFIADQKYIISSLHTWGWITLILGVLQMVAAFSLGSGGGFGRWFGMLTAGLSAISALLSLPAYPFCLCASSPWPSSSSTSWPRLPRQARRPEGAHHVHNRC
jgi:hypothetical protein